MVPLDATNNSVVYENEIKEIYSINSRISDAVKELLEFNADFRKKSEGLDGAIIHDALAVAAVIDMKKTTGNKPNVEVALGLDRKRFIEMLKEMMKAYN
ncbi:hypothetical protein DW1_2287 [Proteiniborus sp. DW1]|uniref:nucleoside hydrolase n=1 Tax=Proteiniborus sp. DW1 TaxID=1889883 RepID=UPI00092DEBE4|nr:nucleoside hydrolase [Proteiniborus sp. DW1]SCG83851.1 hypothetical protein DW1_2287 [Proteiniborus sp. DW1]